MRLKLITLFKVCLGVLAASAPMAKAYTSSSPYTWTGPGSNYSTSGNWSPAGPPGANDSALFSGATSTAITLDESNASVGAFVFTGGTGYTFSLGSGNEFNFEGTGIIGLDGGVSNMSSQTQAFDVSDGVLIFYNSTSANFSATDFMNEVDYNIGLGGYLVFHNESTASSDTYLNLSAGGFLGFYEDSNAGETNITADVSSDVQFNNFSDAYESNITINDDSVLEFFDQSDPDQANILANDDAIVIFNTGATATFPGPMVYLNDNAQLQVEQSNQVASLGSGSTGTVITLSGGTYLQTNEAADVEDVYMGTISGVTGTQLIMDGQGSLQLTQAMSATGYIWDAVANNGYLVGDSTNLDRNLQINEDGTVVFLQNDYGQLDIDNQLTNTGSTGGTLLLVGGPDGLLNIISDNSNFAGTVEVYSGDLAVNTTNGGVLGNGNLFLLVDPDGTLSGTGTVNGTVIVNGTISPGNSIGPFSVTGTYIQNAGSTYSVELNGAGDSDVIVVTGTPGTATLNGGTVAAESIDGTFLIGVPYTILTASGGVSGEYDNAETDINLYLVPTLEYDAHDVYLTLNTGFEAFAENSNEYEVALQLDSIFNPSDDLQFLLQNLVSLSPRELNHALDELSGEQYATLLEISQQSSRRFLRDLYGPLLFGRDIVAECCEEECCERGWCDNVEIWQTVHYGQSYLKNDREGKGYKARNIDAALGVQFDLENCWKAGVAAFYENDHVNFHLDGRARVNIIRAALYGIYQNECYYGLADAVFGYGHYNVKRHIHFAEIDLKPHSTPKIYDGTFYLEGGFNYCLAECVQLQPFFGVEAGYYWQNEFKEKGGYPVDLKGKSKNLWNCDTRLGLRVMATLPCDIQFSADAAWQHWYTEHDNTVHVHFREFGREFRVKGPKFKRNLVDGSIYLGKTFCDKLTVFARAFGERSENYSNYSASIGFDFEL